MRSLSVGQAVTRAPPGGGGLMLGWPLQYAERSRSDVFLRERRGREYSERSNFSKAHRFDEAGHLLTIARTGAGKGVSVVIPTLLSYRGPIIVIDPKGENFFSTMRFRRDVLGHKIFAIDPFGVIADFSAAAKSDVPWRDFQTSGLNVLNPLITKPKIEKADSAALARMMAGMDPMSQKDPYWSNTSQDILAGLIHLVLTHNRVPLLMKKLSTVIDMGVRGDFDDFIERVVFYHQLDIDAKNSLQGYLNIPHENTRGSVRSFLKQSLDIFDSRSVKRAISEDGFDFELLLRDQQFTVYIVFPPEKLVSHARVLQLIVAALLAKVMQRRGAAPVLRTLFLLDECAQLGELQELRQAVTLLRGYGLQVWMFFQDLSQMQRLYLQDWRTLVNNCGVLQGFGFARQSDAEPFAELIENKIASVGGTNELATTLLSLNKTHQIVSSAGTNHEFLALLNYLEDPAFRGRADQNPLHGG